MKVGDLVRLKEYCGYSDRTALVIEIPPHLGCAKIIFIDLSEMKSTLKSNLEVINESR